MKRIFSLLLLICFAFSLAACGGEPADTVSSDNGSGDASSSETVSSMTDTGSASTDTGSASTDTGSASTDTGSASTDTGSASTDTGSASTDTGSASTDTGSASTDTGSASTDSDTASSSTSSDGKTETENKEPVPNLVLAGDQYGQEVVIYDFDELDSGDNLDFAEIWTCKIGVSHIAGLKYREDTVFGDVILVASGAGKGQAHMISYPEGKVLWSTKQAGNNPHCIEILPSGNIVVASSTGSTLRMFKTSALLKNDKTTAATYVDTGLYGAHGVLWDPAYELLWCLGDDVLQAFSLSGEGVEEKMVRNVKKCTNLPSDGGHSIAADFVDSDYLYLSTNSAVYRFNKKACVYVPVFPGSEVVSTKTVKGVAHNGNGNFFLAIPNGGKGTPWQNSSYNGWDTDTLIYCYEEDGKYVKESFKSERGRAIYKISPFNGQYQ